MNRELLERPFPKELLKTRKGTFGRSFSYVEGSHYITRLNAAFEGEWSFDVLEHQILDSEVIVLGKITAGGVAKTAFGGSKITVNRDGEVVSIADDLKASATDALKKASSLLGVGLHLYSEPTTTSHEAPRTGNGQREAPRPTNGQRQQGGNGQRHRPGNGQSSNSRRNNGSNGSNGTNGNGARLTQKQLSAIWSMARALGRSVEEVRQHTTDAYGVQPEHLSKSDASTLIGQMNESLGGTR